MNKLEGIKLKNKEKVLNKYLLRFHNTIKPKSLSEIIYLLYKLYINEIYTIAKLFNSGHNITYSVTTNKPSGNYKSRSGEDLYRLCKYYIPDINYNDIFNILNILIKHKYIKGSYCITCRRDVYSSFIINLEDIKKVIKDLDIQVKNN